MGQHFPARVGDVFQVKGQKEVHVIYTVNRNANRSWIQDEYLSRTNNPRQLAGSRRNGCLSLVRSNGGGTTPTKGGGHHRLLTSSFPCNSHRVNVKISHSRGGGGHGAPSFRSLWRDSSKLKYLCLTWHQMQHSSGIMIMINTYNCLA